MIIFAKAVSTIAIGFLLASAALPAAATPDPESGDAPRPRARRVSNGADAPQGRFPYYTYIAPRFNDGVTACGATLIAPRWLLTAAHCISKPNSGRIELVKSFDEIQVGMWKIGRHIYQASYDKLVFPIQPDAYAEGKGEKVMDNDIALVHLTTPIAPDILGLQVVPLSRESPPLGQRAMIIGFGKKWHNALEGASTLQQGEVSVVDSRSHCGDIGHAEICVGNPDQESEFTNALPGDSGGPLLIMSPDGTIVRQAGVGSRAWKRVGDGDSDVNRYAIFTDVAQHLGWIQHAVDRFPAEDREGNGEVAYTCTFARAGEQDGDYALTACEAAGQWHAVAPYLARTASAYGGYKGGRCRYSTQAGGWDCPDGATPIAHYEAFFGAPKASADGRTHTARATVPLTDLGR
ncbi:Peptidase S1 domain-containing protein [Bordetella sputigena]|uniref:S1 family peptidase n=1 Tax=Bordetella sputigena TaxID=1416810 RepID=UPI0039F0422A